MSTSRSPSCQPSSISPTLKGRAPRSPLLEASASSAQSRASRTASYPPSLTTGRSWRSLAPSQLGMPVASSTPVSADQSYPTHALRTPACRAETSVTASMISGHRLCAVSQAQRVVAGSESMSTPSRPTTMVGSLVCMRAGGARRPRMALAASSTIIPRVALAASSTIMRRFARGDAPTGSKSMRGG